MYGPEQPGHWSSLVAPNCGKKHQFLRADRWYTVSKAFVDYDGDRHEEGERWAFLGYSFLPYEDGMSWFVSLDGIREWQIRLQWRPDAQGMILDNLKDYMVEDQTQGFETGAHAEPAPK
jgi:hypothetical protein